MYVPPTVIQNGVISRGIFRKVAPVDEVAIERVANVRWVNRDVGVVGGGIKAVGAKGVPV